MIKQRKDTILGVRVPIVLKAVVAYVVETGPYLNTSDFLRDALREKRRRDNSQRYTELRHDAYQSDRESSGVDKDNEETQH